MAFQGSAADAMAFFDLSGSETLRIDEFLFGVRVGKLELSPYKI